jgi:integrase/recombinase XerD
MRLGAVRGFARYLHEVDPRVEVPAADLLPDKSGRAVPYVYTDAQIAAWTDAAETLRIAHKTATLQTLFGLLAVIGMRIDEAIALVHDLTGCPHVNQAPEPCLHGRTPHTWPTPL